MDSYTSNIESAVFTILGLAIKYLHEPYPNTVFSGRAGDFTYNSEERGWSFWPLPTRFQIYAFGIYFRFNIETLLA